MKLKLISIAGTAAALTIALTGCSTAGSEARNLTEQWLEGDTTAQCVAAPSTWSTWELGEAELLGEVDGADRWAVEITGVRSMAPARGGHLIVDLSDGGGCVRWYEWPQ